MHLLRCLFFVEAAFNFTFLPQHLPGRLNEIDALSRNSISPTMLQSNGLELHPTVIHREIPDLLLNMQVDWLSQTWTALFNSILSKVWVHPHITPTQLISIALTSSAQSTTSGTLSHYPKISSAIILFRILLIRAYRLALSRSTFLHYATSKYC